MEVVVGPCACHTCKARVWWVRMLDGSLRLLGADGRQHVHRP